MNEYAYGYCGMPCALCSRYRTEGKSRCPGCSHDGYYTDVCKVHHCCREKGHAHCAVCDDYICERLGRMSDFSDLHTDNVKQRTGAKIEEAGFEKWYEEYAKRAELLTVAMEHYNNGRMKRFLCELFIQNDLETLENLMEQAEELNTNPDVKERGKAFRKMAEPYVK